MAESIRRSSRTPAATTLRHLTAGPRPTDALERLVSARTAPVTLFAVALGLGIILRVGAIGLGDGFPLNDGGMFMAMVEDIRANGYALPETTSYNGGDIPFAYPPLPFYAAAALNDVAGVAVLDTLIYLPLLFSLLTIPAFWLLARAMLEKPLYASLATLLFVSIPRSYNWEVIGGGLTRSPGFFFATLAIWQAFELFRSGRRRHLAPAILLSALTVLCHMEMGWFVAFTTLFLAVWHRREPQTLANAALLAAGVALLTAPWYLTVLLRSGSEPLLSALQSGGHSPSVLLAPLFLRFTDASLFPVGLSLGLLGLLAALRDRRYLLPVWLLLIFLLDPRKAATVSTLPLAMLATIGLLEVVWPLLKRDGRAPVWAFVAVGFLLAIYAPASSALSSAGDDSPLYAIPPGQREAMSWVAANTAESAAFIVVPSANRWANDGPAEWFPALAGRQSLNTVQGGEWLGRATYTRLREDYDALALCGGRDVACIEGWIAGSSQPPTHVFVPKGDSPAGTTVFNRQRLDCCRVLLESLRAAPGYRPVFENADAAVFERTSR